MNLHKFAKIYDRLNSQPNLQELISIPIIEEQDNMRREEAQQNQKRVFQELKHIINVIHLCPYKDFILNGKTNIGQYIFYVM
tara:strand:- start:681 stop:926 length:246 start_codon:yes stop_codon:yes gene_type:complete